MSATYSGDPAASLSDEVRHLTGDTDVRTGRNLFEDEQIAYAIAKAADDPYAAAAELLEQLAVRAAIEPTMKRIGDTTIQFATDRAKQLRDRSDGLRPGTLNPRTVGATMGGSTGTPWVRREQAYGIGLEFPVTGSTFSTGSP